MQTCAAPRAGPRGSRGTATLAETRAEREGSFILCPAPGVRLAAWQPQGTAPQEGRGPAPPAPLKQERPTQGGGGHHPPPDKRGPAENKRQTAQMGAGPEGLPQKAQELP